MSSTCWRSRLIVSLIEVSAGINCRDGSGHGGCLSASFPMICSSIRPKVVCVAKWLELHGGGECLPWALERAKGLTSVGFAFSWDEGGSIGAMPVLSIKNSDPKNRLR